MLRGCGSTQKPKKKLSNDEDEDEDDEEEEESGYHGLISAINELQISDNKATVRAFYSSTYSSSPCMLLLMDA